MENELTPKFHQKSVSSVNSGTMERTLLNILIGKRSIFVLLIILAALEVVGLERIFHRSERLHNFIQYTFYVGDGDTKHMDMGNSNLFLLSYFVHMRSFVLAFCNFAFFQFLIFQKG